MIMKKKLSLLFAAILLLGLLSGCSQGGGNTDQLTEGKDLTTSAQETAPEEVSNIEVTAPDPEEIAAIVGTWEMTSFYEFEQWFPVDKLDPKEFKVYYMTATITDNKDMLALNDAGFSATLTIQENGVASFVKTENGQTLEEKGVVEVVDSKNSVFKIGKRSFFLWGSDLCVPLGEEQEASSRRFGFFKQKGQSSSDEEDLSGFQEFFGTWYLVEISTPGTIERNMISAKDAGINFTLTIHEDKTAEYSIQDKSGKLKSGDYQTTWVVYSDGMIGCYDLGLLSILDHAISSENGSMEEFRSLAFATGVMSEGNTFYFKKA